MKTFCEFTFDAAHSVPPHSIVHGHTFVAKLTFGGDVDPEFGWPVNLYDVEKFIADLKGDHHKPGSGGIDHCNFDNRPEIGAASLENINRFLWRTVKARFSNLEEIELKRGLPGISEGCTYRGERDNLNRG